MHLPERADCIHDMYLMYIQGDMYIKKAQEYQSLSMAMSGLPWQLTWERIHLQCRRPWFYSWVRKFPWRRDWLPTPVFLGFPGGSDSKESARNAGDLGLIPGLGRSPGGGHGNPLQYFCLENPMDRGAWWAKIHRVEKSWARQKQLSTQRELRHVKLVFHNLCVFLFHALLIIQLFDSYYYFLCKAGDTCPPSFSPALCLQPGSGRDN